MAAGGMDMNVSLSASSSATSGLDNKQETHFGDFIIGRGAGKSEGLPAWAMVAIAGAILVGVSIFLVRK
jgi:hypothetical protein